MADERDGVAPLILEVYRTFAQTDPVAATSWVDRWLLRLLGITPPGEQAAIASIQGTIAPGYRVLFPLRFGKPGASLLPDPVTVQLDTGDFELTISVALAQQLGIPESPFGSVTGVDGQPVPVDAGMVDVDWAPFAVTPEAQAMFDKVNCIIDPTIGVGSGPEYCLFGSRFFATRGLELRVNYRTGLVSIYPG